MILEFHFMPAASLAAILGGLVVFSSCYASRSAFEFAEDIVVSLANARTRVEQSS